MDARWSNFFNQSSGCSRAGVAASCNGHMRQNGFESEMRNFFGDSYFDLPGNNNELARSEAAYTRRVSEAFAAYTAQKNQQTKPKKPKLGRFRRRPKQTPKQRAEEVAQKGNSEDKDGLPSGLTLENFTQGQASWIRYELKKLVNPNCPAAYEVSQNPLRSPRTIMETRGVVIRHASALSSRSAADLGLDQASYGDAQKKINTGQWHPSVLPSQTSWLRTIRS